MCRRFLEIGRDNNLWRNECLEFAEAIRRIREGLPSPTISASEPRFRDRQSASTEDQVGESSVTSEGSHDWRERKHRATERIRVIANWDPSYQAEKVDWYTEFIHRTSDMHIGWFQRPYTLGAGTESPLETRGMGTYYHPGNNDMTMAIAPLEDGSICLWDAKGHIIGRSAEGSLCEFTPNYGDIGIANGISVDNERNKAFIAIRQGGYLELCGFGFAECS